MYVSIYASWREDEFTCLTRVQNTESDGGSWIQAEDIYTLLHSISFS